MRLYCHDYNISQLPNNINDLDLLSLRHSYMINKLCNKLFIFTYMFWYYGRNYSVSLKQIKAEYMYKNCKLPYKCKVIVKKYLQNNL